MKNKLISLILLTVTVLIMLCPAASAVTPLDPDAEASLTLYYQKDGISFPDLTVSIYRVARANEDGSFTMIAPYSSYPFNIYGITSQEQWNNVAQTVLSFVVAKDVQPDRELTTAADGSVSFTGLETGLYFVKEAVAKTKEGTYIFNQFMVYLPTPTEDGFDYDVEARPKCRSFVANPQLTVTKLWQDSGENRPSSVTVDIYKDGELQETVVLDSGNNWTYTWYVTSNDYNQWVVTERAIKDYEVTVQQNGDTFLLINTGQPNQKPPQTGDTFSPMPWMLIMGLAGAVLVILGMRRRNRV